MASRAHLGDERADAAVLMSRIRWAGIALAASLSIFGEPLVINVPLALAACAVMALYNLPAAFARRLPAGWIERVLAISLIGDFVAISVFVVLAANDPQDLTFVAFVLVAVEAAVLYRWRGSVPLAIGAVVVIAAACWERSTFFHIPSTAPGFLQRAGLIALTAVFLGRIAETSERRREEALRQSDRYEALNAVASRLGKTLNQDYVLETVVDSLARLFPHRWHGILLRTEAGVQELRHVRGVPSEMRFTIREPAAYESGPIRIGDIRTDKNVAILRDELPAEMFELYASCTVIPLRAGERLFGILVTLDPEPDALTEDDVAFLQALGGHASAALVNAQLYEEVERLSLTDVTTGLYNRRAFNRRLRDELERASRYQLPLSLLMVDVDHFKIYNDRHGHPAGDVVLRKLGEVLTGKALRASDIASRFGGEEFVVILPQADLDAAMKSAERLRAEVAETAFPDELDQPLGGITVSIGVASYPTQASSGAELVERADLALYEAKRQGRDRVVAFTPS